MDRSRRTLVGGMALASTGISARRLLYGADPATNGDPALLMTQAPLRIPAGDSVRFRAYLKSSEVTGIGALCWQRLDHGVQQLHFDPATAPGIRGTASWQHLELNIPSFPVDATIRLGIALAGKGTLWANSFSIDIGTKPVTDELVLDPGRWVPPRGYSTQGYEVALLRRWMHSGSATDAERENAPTLMIRSDGSR